MSKPDLIVKGEVEEPIEEKFLLVRCSNSFVTNLGQKISVYSLDNISLSDYKEWKNSANYKIMELKESELFEKLDHLFGGG